VGSNTHREVENSLRAHDIPDWLTDANKIVLSDHGGGLVSSTTTAAYYRVIASG